MQKPDIPKNDDRRVNALEALEILDTNPEEQLDFITKIVKERFNVPIALISLVDKKRQWFKSKQGLSANETSRDISFCGHAILNTGIFEITNAIEDSRFKDNPLVLGAPNIRFYAGAPITTVDGYRIGTLCIIDNKARKLNPSEKEDLESFAQLVQSHITKKDLQPHLEQLLDNAFEGLIEINLEGNFVFVNQFGANLLGYTIDELAGKSLHQIIPKKKYDGSTHKSPLILENIAKNIGLIFEADVDLIRKDGLVIHASCHFQPIFKLGKVSTTLMSFVDNFERDALKAEVFWHKEQADKIFDARVAKLGLRTLLDEATDGIHIIDMQGNLMHFSPSFAQMLGYTVNDLQHLNVRDWDAQFSSAEISQQIVKLSTSPSLFETTHRRKDGALIDVQVHAKMIQIDAKECIYCSARDITMQKQEQVQMAFYDPLTYLANRRLLEDHINRAFSINRRAKSYGALLYLDLDNFKSLNDTHGHEAGDHLLLEVAKRLKSCVREIDTVSRVGGDEFAILITELEADEVIAKQYAIAIAEKVRFALEEPYKIMMQSQSGDVILTHHCPASIGITMFSGAKKSYNELLKEADTAMYEAKQSGRNLVRLYQPN